VSCRRVAFSRYHLIRLLGWRDEGRSYQRLDTSLNRWLGVTLYFQNAWWNAATKTWMNRGFHVLEDYTTPADLWSGTQTGGLRARRLPCTITWHEVVFQSFENGRLKKLDMELYRTLTSAVAKRMYRFLDKRFWFSATLTYELKRFAFEHVGLSRCYDNSQIRRLLRPALLELEAVGFLAPLPAEKRYEKVCRGRWNIRLVRADCFAKSRNGRKPAREPVPERAPATPASLNARRRGGPAAPTEGPHPKAGDGSGQRIEDFLSALPAERLAQFEQEAFEQADALHLDGYRRNLDLGRCDLADHWRRIIVHGHAARKLGLS